MRVLGRFVLAAGAGISVLLFGVLAAMVLGGFAALERTAANGHGFLMLEFVAIGVLICDCCCLLGAVSSRKEWRRIATGPRAAFLRSVDFLLLTSMRRRPARTALLNSQSFLNFCRDRRAHRLHLRFGLGFHHHSRQSFRP